MPHLLLVSLVSTLLLVPVLGGVATAQTPHPSFDVKVSGRGPAIVMIPGLLSSGAVWDGAAARYQDRYTVHVLTLAGFGGPAPVGAPFLSRVRDEVVTYIREQKLQKPVIVGHSLGGFLGFWIAATAPDLIGGLVAVDGVPFLSALGNPAATAAGAKAQAEQFQALYASFSRDQLVAQSRMALAAMITAPENVERALTWVAASDPATAGRAIAELSTTDLREAAAAITAPTLLIGASGAAPETMRAGMAQAYEAQVSRMKGARVIMADKARHFIMFDDPDFLFSALDQFLAERKIGAGR
jgi:pimeloyl-ACP methyl ester carboxylesterase